MIFGEEPFLDTGSIPLSMFVHDYYKKEHNSAQVVI